MSTYLLLRDNKESGPFSLDDLLAKGLKAYDLVWVPGKSAAWRYPSEIEELKAYAPAIEEQPFDRFYKKQEEEIPVLPQQQQQSSTSITANSAYAPKPRADKPAYTPKKSVFVTLPSGNTVKTTPPEPKPQPAIKKEDPVPMPATTLNESLKSTITVTENTETTLQTKYSQPLDDIKEMYVKTLVDRKQRNSHREFVTRHLKVAVIVFVLIGAGVLLGSMIRSSGVRKEAKVPVQQITTPVSPDVIAQNRMERLADAEPVIVNPPLYAGEEEQLRKSIKEKTRDTEDKKSKMTELPVEENATSSTGITPSTVAGKALTPRTEKRTEPQEQALYQTYETTSGGERNARTRTSNTPTSDNNSNRQQNRFVPPVSEEDKPFGKEVTVLSNQYKRVPFGGIRNLQLTVYNRSATELQKVVVELQYLKPSEQPLKTQMVEFESIAPNSSATIKIPDTNRGIDIAYEIKKVVAK